MELSSIRLAVVDDDADMLMGSKLMLKSQVSDLSGFPHPEKLLEHAGDPFEMILLDLNYHQGEVSGREGMHYLKEIKKRWPGSIVLAMTAYAQIDLAIEAVKTGAYDFVTKPWQKERLMLTLNKALEAKNQEERIQLQSELHDCYLYQLPPMIGEHELMAANLERINQLKDTREPICIYGEKGTGKKLLAQHIHKASCGSELPFIDVHSKWGSNWKEQLGQIREATLYIQQEEVIHEGELQRDRIRLIYGIQNQTPSIEQDDSLTIELPALRERRTDIPELVHYFIEYYAKQLRIDQARISPELMHWLTNRDFQENVAELEDCIRWAMKQNHKGELRIEHMPSSQAIDMDLASLEESHIRQILNRYQGNISKSASALGITRAALYRRMEKYKIES